MRTVRDVARLAGVSSATVSRVLNGHPYVNESARGRVLEAAAMLGFQPNRMARSLRTGRGHSVALLVGDIEQKLYAALTKHVQVTLGQIGLDVLVYNLDHSAQRLRGFLETAPSLGLCGMALGHYGRDRSGNRPHPARPAESGHYRRVVDASGWSSGEFPRSSMRRKKQASARSRFCWKAGAIPSFSSAGSPAPPSVSARYRGYAAALDAAGLTLRPELVCDISYRFQAGYEAITQALDAGTRFRAVQAGSDEIALGAMAALHDRGLKVPSDVAVVGFGDIDWGAHIRPALTTLSVHHDMTAAALRDLLQAPDDAATVRIIGRSLILRGST